MLFSWPRALLALLAAVILSELIVIAPRPAVLMLAAVAIWMAAPGVRLVRATLQGDVHGLSWLVGPAIGMAFSVLGALVIWSAGLKNWMALLLGPGLTWTIAWLIGRGGGWRFRVPVIGRRDLAAVALALAVVPLITWAPYDHVREPVADGDAYRAYFTADFVWAMTVTSELAKGEVPPVNPFLAGSGQTLHYYWMAHFLSGALYRNVAPWGVTAEQVVLVDGLAFGLVFVAFLYGLIRWAGASPGFAALAVIVGFCANSYEAVNRLWILWRDGLPFEILKEYNIDAVTRWFYQGMPVDGLQRLLLYQPHHLTGYVMGLASLWLVCFAEDVSEIGIALCAGVLLGLGFLFSTFTAIIFGAAIGMVYAYRLVEQRAWRALIPCAVLGGGSAAVGVLLTYVLGYTEPRAGNLIQVGLNPVATHLWPLMLLLSFGPLLFGGVIGGFRLQWARRDGAAAIALLLSSLAFYFLTNVPDMDSVWVGWRAGHQLLIAFSVIGGALLTTAWSRRQVRPLLIALVVMLCIPAVPTVAIDVYNAQDITNRLRGPSFPWTLVITPPEREALDWLKRSTPADAVVQVEPVRRGSDSWAYIPAFAERRMAAGLPIAMIPFRKFQEASETVQVGIFLATRAADIHAMARALHIDYIWIGDVERRAYRGAVEQMATSPETFPQVFSNAAVTVYAVRP